MVQYNESTLQDDLLASVAPAETQSILQRPLRETGWRWIALILMNLLVLGDFISIDNPQPLQSQMEKILGIDSEEYSMLYSVWALPSIIIPFFGGYLTDKLGVRPALLIFSSALTIGQFVYAYGGYILDFKWMLIGRAIYAIGSDPLNVAQIVITNKWFMGNEVGFAMALGTTTCGIGRALNSYLVPKLFEMSQNLFSPMLFSAITCLLAAVAAVFMVILDKANDKSEPLPDSGSDNGADEEKMSLKDIKYFSSLTWLLIINFGLTNGIFFSFNAFTNDLYSVEYNFTNSEAGTILSTSFIITAVSSTFFGKVVDKHGYRATFIMYNSLLGILAFAFFLIYPSGDKSIITVIPQILFGLLIGVNDAATFPSLPFILEEKYLGTGYGLFFVIQNILVLVFPPLAAIIKSQTADNHDGFYWMYIFFGVGMLLTFFESIWMFVVDKKTGRVLDKTIVTDEDVASMRATILDGTNKADFDIRGKFKGSVVSSLKDSEASSLKTTLINS